MFRNLIASIPVLFATLAFSLSAVAQNVLRPQYLSEGLGRSFVSGEDLTYTVRYGFVTGGLGHFTVRDTTINGRRVNHIVCAGQTTGVADVFFKVHDSYESYLDAETQKVVMSKRNIREGKYKYNDVVTYDNRSHLISKSIRKRDKPEIHATQSAPVDIIDMVGAFYHARNNAFSDNLSVGDTISYETFFSNEIFPLRIVYRGKETIKTKLGKIECLKLSPVTEVGRTFNSDDDMHLWITNDGNHLPVKIQFDLTVGSFVCELTDASGLKNPY